VNLFFKSIRVEHDSWQPFLFCSFRYLLLQRARMRTTVTHDGFRKATGDECVAGPAGTVQIVLEIAQASDAKSRLLMTHRLCKQKMGTSK
jgi:hypothetical protein